MSHLRFVLFISESEMVQALRAQLLAVTLHYNGEWSTEVLPYNTMVSCQALETARFNKMARLYEELVQTYFLYRSGVL